MRPTKHLLLIWILTISNLFSNALAQDPPSTPFKLPHRASAMITNIPTEKRKDVFLLNITLSETQKNNLRSIASVKKNHLFTQANSEQTTYLPKHVSLGMNEVPVLDQGRHGSCVVFAVTAAIDALLQRGDYISQLCLLELGSYLEKRSYLASGWNGSLSEHVMDRIVDFGVISKRDQAIRSCSGITSYPAQNELDFGTPMSLDEYIDLSHDIHHQIYSVSLLHSHEILTESKADKLVKKIKQLIASNNATAKLRMTTGVVLPVNRCFDGACASYHRRNDTWALTQTIINDILTDKIEVGGHEMIITGYDDNAVVHDNEGGTHRGLFILRNSWGQDVGDNGNFYMTYEFFEQFANEVMLLVKDH